MLLEDPAAARTRRVAARPPRHGQRPLETTGGRVRDARTLAHAVATEPEQGTRLLLGGAADRWLRRSLGDPAMAARLDEVVRLHAVDATIDASRADALMAMRAVAVLDPLAPLCWHGLALWPDGLGPALAAAAAEGEPGGPVAERLADLVACEASGHWAMARPDRCEPVEIRAEARTRRAVAQLRGWSGGLPRLSYALNPLQPCLSPLLAGRWVARLADLPAALEAAAGRPEARRGLPIDRDIAAFVGARHDQRLEAGLAGLADTTPVEQAVLIQLQVLAALQRRAGGQALPGLTGWLAEQAAPVLAGWRNRSHREALQRATGEVARTGQLTPMLALLDNPAARTADANGFRAAGTAVQRIDAELAALTAGAPARAATAERIGQEVALGIAMTALTAAVVALVLA